MAQSAARGPLSWLDLPPHGALGEHEVRVKVHVCSVCHSDLHLLEGEWGVQAMPFVPGHEIVGQVVAKGVKANVVVGARVGVGWQAGCCGTCEACTSGRSHLCTGGKKRTCVGRIGGFAEEVVVDDAFCFPIPEAIDSAHAAPLLCAGLTVFSPLERFGVREGMRVGVVGVGGLGHLAVAFARKLGAQVIAFDPHDDKRALAMKLGAHEFRAIGAPLPENAVDLLLVTTHANLPWTEWMNVLRLEGTLCLVGVPSQPLHVSVDPLLDGQKRVTGTVVGSPSSMRRMLAFAAEHEVRPIVETLSMSDANRAVSMLAQGKARLRIVLTHDA